MDSFRVAGESLDSICQRFQLVIKFLKELEREDQVVDVAEQGVLERKGLDSDKLETDNLQADTLQGDRGTTGNGRKEYELGTVQEKKDKRPFDFAVIRLITANAFGELPIH
jgi:hypothetical protein